MIAPAHISQICEFLTKTTVTMPHLPCLLGMATCDFFLFPKMKGSFVSIKELKTKSLSVK